MNKKITGKQAKPAQLKNAAKDFAKEGVQKAKDSFVGRKVASLGGTMKSAAKKISGTSEQKAKENDGQSVKGRKAKTFNAATATNALRDARGAAEVSREKEEEIKDAAKELFKQGVKEVDQKQKRLRDE